MTDEQPPVIRASIQIPSFLSVAGRRHSRSPIQGSPSSQLGAETTCNSLKHLLQKAKGILVCLYAPLLFFRAYICRLLHASLVAVISLHGFPCLYACSHRRSMHHVGIYHVPIRSLINLNPVNDFYQQKARVLDARGHVPSVGQTERKHPSIRRGYCHIIVNRKHIKERS